RDPAQRFQSAREFGDALAGYLFSHQLKVTRYDIAAVIKDTLAEGKDKPKAPQSLIDKRIQEVLGRFTSIEEKDEDGSSPLDAGDVGGTFENPADWFADDDFGAALGGGDEDVTQQIVTQVEAAPEAPTPAEVSTAPAPAEVSTAPA